MALIKMTIVVLLIALMMIFYWPEIRALESAWFPIKYVRVGGQFQYLDQNKVRELLKPVVNTGFFSADLQAVQATVVALAWVEKAEVQRVWPDTLAITIAEQHAVARWQEQALLNKRGEAFSPNSVDGFADLPILNGADGQAQRLFETMNKIISGLQNRNLSLRQFQVTERQSWQITLANGINLQLGRAQPMQKFKRFLKLLPILGESKLALIKTVDMRYPNGFSILWKTDAPLDWGLPNRE